MAGKWGDDIATPRLLLRLMDDVVAKACLDGDLAEAGRRLGTAVPDEMLAHLSGLRFGRERLREDPAYRAWSTRAVIRQGVMVGHVRFHTCPDPPSLHKYARNAVEIGYLIFEAYRRQGYALEAVGAMMDWAAGFGIDRFVASVAPDNAASMRLMGRFGFEKVDEVVDPVDGIEHVFLR